MEGGVLHNSRNLRVWHDPVPCAGRGRTPVMGAVRGQRPDTGPEQGGQGGERL